MDLLCHDIYCYVQTLKKLKKRFDSKSKGLIIPKKREKEGRIGESQTFRERTFLSVEDKIRPGHESNSRPSAYKAEALPFKLTIAWWWRIRWNPLQYSYILSFKRHISLAAQCKRQFSKLLAILFFVGTAP
ncbi:hypothetical protein M8J77_002499 [Diaphorina citri]|nr:hypothetical protein M8J77_002499 [Diaphorina citri]